MADGGIFADLIPQDDGTDDGALSAAPRPGGDFADLIPKTQPKPAAAAPRAAHAPGGAFADLIPKQAEPRNRPGVLDPNNVGPADQKLTDDITALNGPPLPQPKVPLTGEAADIAAGGMPVTAGGANGANIVAGLQKILGGTQLPDPTKPQDTPWEAFKKTMTNAGEGLKKTAGGLITAAAQAAPEPAIAATMGQQELDAMASGGPQVDPNLARNQQYLKPGAEKITDFRTKLSPEAEKQFQAYIKDHSDPKDLGRADGPDYDMRGWWAAAQRGDPRAALVVSKEDGLKHRNDWWKTPLHQSFSVDSQWANADAPRWHGSQLIDSNGAIVHDDAAPAQPQTPIGMMQAARENSPLAKFGKKIAGEAQKHIKANVPNVPGASFTGVADELVSGVVNMAPLMAASVVTKSAAPVLLGFAAQGYGEKYADSIAAGRTPQQADMDASFSAAANALPATLPVHAIMRPGQKFLGKVFTTAFSAGAQNVLTAGMQMGYDKGVLHDGMTWGQAWPALVKAGIIGTITGAVLGAGEHAISKIPGKPAVEVPVDGIVPVSEPVAPTPVVAAKPVVKGRKPTVPDAVANPVAAPQAVHDPVTWAQTGWKLPSGETVALDDPRATAPQPTITDSVIPPTGDGTKASPVDVSHPDHIRQAAEMVNTEPTDAQKGAGNYQKGHIKVQGLDIAIENPEGSERSGTNPATGEKWSVQMPAHYGYIKRTTGADKEQVDVYVGPDPVSKKVFVVDQKDAETGAFDEHKVMLGYQDVPAAKLAYLAAFSDGKGNERIGAIHSMTMDEFKTRMAKGKFDKPLGKDFTTTPGAIAAEHAAEVSAIEAQGTKAADPALKAAKKALKTNIDPETGARPKGAKALREFRARMQAVVDGTNVSHETVRQDVSPVSESVPIGSIPKKGKLLGVKRAIEKDADHAAAIIGRSGGLRNDEGHDLVKGRGLQQMIPGVGPLIRPKGMSVDAAGEVLWNEGFWGPPDKTPRPTENEVLQLLERTRRGPDNKPTKVYRPERAAELETDRVGAKAEEDNTQARADITKYAKTYGQDYSPEVVDQIMGQMGEHGIDHETAVNEHMERAALESHGELRQIIGHDQFEDVPFDTAAPEVRPAEDGRAVGEGRGAPEGAAGDEGKGAAVREGDARVEPEAERGETGLDQTIVPGTARSARQLAQAREAAGKGKIKPKTEQKDAGGMFEDKSQQTKDMFDQPAPAKKLKYDPAELAPAVEEYRSLHDANKKLIEAANDADSDVRRLRFGGTDKEHGDAVERRREAQKAANENHDKMIAAAVKWDKKGVDLNAEIEKKPAAKTDEVFEGKDGEDIPFARRQKIDPKAEHPTETPEFKRWFGGSKVVDKDGKPVRVYHGTQRPDRIGNRFRKNRATSGPMSFFTEDPELASSYATGKQDTSLYNEDQNYETWFKAKVPGQRTRVSVDRMWWHLSQEERQKVADLAPRVGRDDEGNIMLHPEGEKRGLGGYDQHIKEARGNHLKALVDEWLNSGALFNDEGEFSKVLKLSGVERKFEEDFPHAQYPAVIPTYLSIKNPLDTTAISKGVVDALNKAASRQRRAPDAHGADIWAKNSRSARDWMDTLHEGIAKPESNHAFTSIPDWVTKTLQDFGYDGIKDVGGKLSNGKRHNVWIPFEETQVKSAVGNRGTFDPNNKRIDFSLREGGAPEPVFYSALTRAVEDMKQEKAPAGQWLAAIKNKPGVKAEEIAWSGVEDWLKEQKGPVTKAGLLQHLRENEVQVKEVEKGGSKVADLEAKWNKAADAVNKALADRIPQAEEDRLRKIRDDLRDKLEAAKENPSNTKFAQYTLPGGENYRELLLTLPATEPKGYKFHTNPNDGPNGRTSVVDQEGRELGVWKTREAAIAAFKRVSGDFTSGHWDEPNILAHIRFDDRTGPNGEKVLHIAEVQSDWHQKGRRAGYASEPTDEQVMANVRQHQGRWTYKNSHGAWGSAPTRERAIESSRRELRQDGVPNAPFKSTWHDLAMKRMLRYAAENGYDRVSWDSGDTNAERYDLSKQIDRIVYQRHEDGQYTVRLFKDRFEVGNDTMPKEKLPDYIGKEIADRIVNGAGKKAGFYGEDKGKMELEGLDLKVGGEGMRGFYDKILPSSVGKLVKRFGGKVEPSRVNKGGEPDWEYRGPEMTRDQIDRVWDAARARGQVWDSPITGERQMFVVNRVANEQAMRGVAEAVDRGMSFKEAMREYGTRDLAKIFGGDMADTKTEMRGADVHSVAITPAMREGVSKAQPLFAKKKAPAGWDTAGGDHEGANISREGRGQVKAHTRFTPEFDAQRAELTKELRKRLNQIGLTDIALKVPDWIKAVGENQSQEFGSYADGFYSPLKRLIAVAIDSKKGWENAIDHESIHALRDLGLINDKEWAVLSKKAGEWAKKYDIEKTYAPIRAEKVIEEAIAHAFPDFVAGKLGNAGGAVNRIFRKISNFFEAARNALDGLGFKSADDIFRDIDSGKIGNRDTPDRMAMRAEPSLSLREEEKRIIANDNGQLLPGERTELEAAHQKQAWSDFGQALADHSGWSAALREAGAHRAIFARDWHISRDGQTELILDKDWNRYAEIRPLKDGFTLSLNGHAVAERFKSYPDAVAYALGESEENPSFARRPKQEEESRKAAPGIWEKIDAITGKTTEAVYHGIADAVDRISPQSVKDAASSIRMALTPMAAGSPEARAAGKDFANGMREARHITRQQFDFLTKNFMPKNKPDQLEKMWAAADEESVLLQQEQKPGLDQGLNRLTPEQRAVVVAYQAESNAALKEAMDIGLFKGEGLPSYVPRMVVAIGADGKANRLGYDGSGATGLDALGRNLKTTSPNLRQRKHLTTEETEEAAQHLDPNAMVVKDIRTLPLAMGRLREAIAGRRLINQIREIGRSTGETTVSEGEEPQDDHKWFTIDHPAFKIYRPKVARDQNGDVVLEGNKVKMLKDEDGNLIFEKVPLFVRDDFEGPLRAVLSQDMPKVMKAIMTLKGKTMSIIMYSPMMHNMVIWGKAFPTAPLKMLNPLWKDANGEWHVSLELYGRGRQAKKDPVIMKEAIRNGLDPIGHRFGITDATGLVDEPNLKPGRSWTSQAFAYIPEKLWDKETGDKVRRTIDKAGDVWHNKLLWDMVGDLQMGLYTHLRDAAVKHGADDQTAGRYAAHFANRYAGALPIEAMSKSARMWANMLLFSRSFTLTNLGAFKDLTNGLPKDIQAQILRDKGTAALEKIQGTARRKAASLLIMDIALAHVGVALAAYTVAWMAGTAYQSPDENEAGKENRFLIRYDQDGTAIYGRMPVGKVGEDLQDWALSPTTVLKKKLSPMGHAAYGVLTNDKGFGQKIYDPYDASALGYAQNAGRVAGFVLDSMLPIGPFEVLGEMGKKGGKGDASTKLLQLTLPFAGITVSKGAPGGPAMGQLYASKDEHEFQVGEHLPEIKEKIRAGDIQGATAEMADLGISRSYMRFLIRTTQHPGAKLTRRQLQEFLGYATPGEKEKMKKFIEDDRERKAEKHSDLEPGDLKGALKAGDLTRYAAAGGSWTRQEAIQAASGAGLSATAAALRDTPGPIRPKPSQNFVGERAAG